jgi:hypothetical protein
MSAPSILSGPLSMTLIVAIRPPWGSLSYNVIA